MATIIVLIVLVQTSNDDMSQEGVAVIAPVICWCFNICRSEHLTTILRIVNQRAPVLLAKIVGTSLPVGILKG